ncbi:MAG: hypothetical protein V4664_02775 [Patescibacteria group bacterium]
MNRILVASIVVVLLLAFGFALFDKKEIVVPRESYKDATYFIDGSYVTLKNGVAETEAVPGSASKVVTKYFGNEAIGDLNNDGTIDTAFLLTQQTGGSGTFYYIVVALKTAEGYVQTNAIFLGDRIAPMPTEIRDGVVIVNYSDRRAGDPMTTQPSVGVTKKFRVSGGNLVQTKR